MLSHRLMYEDLAKIDPVFRPDAVDREGKIYQHLQHLGFQFNVGAYPIYASQEYRSMLFQQPTESDELSLFSIPVTGTVQLQYREVPA